MVNIQYIQHTIHFSTYKLFLNSLAQVVRPTRGVKQGDTTPTAAAVTDHGHYELRTSEELAVVDVSGEDKIIVCLPTSSAVKITR